MNKRRHIARSIMLACDHYHLNAELMTCVLPEHLATPRSARKHILYGDNRPEAHNISSKGEEKLLFRRYDPRNEFSSTHT